jgi:NAD(P)-dependent dehydrogenase (short-subunit alcohol dehydrogenase family)
MSDARKKRKEATNQEKYMGKLEGKIALITGGNGGIGLETAKQFVNEGAYVFITVGRDPELVAAVKEIGENVIGVQGKVSNLGGLGRLFAQIKRQKRRLDIVFVNAGVEKRSPFGRITDEGYRSDSDINVKGLFLRCRRRFPCCRMAPRSFSIRSSWPPMGRRRMAAKAPQGLRCARSGACGQRT